MTRTRVVLVAVAVLVSTVAVGCGSSGGDSNGSKGQDGGVTVQKSPKVGPDTAQELTPRELVEALASSGIGVYEDPSSTTPVRRVTDAGPVKLIQDQVDVMARQTRDRSGTVGAQIDAVIGPLDGAPDFSLILAAYVKAGNTQGAKVSRRIMGDQTWEQAADVVFPDVVLALFSNDVARQAQAATPSGLRAAPLAPASRSAAQLPVRLGGDATGVCSTLAGWVDGVISTIVDALKVDTTGGGLTGLLGDIWNTVVDLAVAAGKAAVGALTAPVVAIVKGALAIAGTISMVASLLRPWSVSAEQKPEPANYGVDPNGGNEVEIEATVDPGTKDGISAGVADCAKQAGVEVPDPTSAKGGKVTWKHYGVEEVGTDISFDDTVGADNTADLRFTTKTESQEDAEKGEPIAHTVAVSIAVERTQVKDLQKLLSTLLTGTIPSVVAPIVGAVLDLITQPIFDALAEMLGTGGSGSGIVISHGPAKPDEKPPVTSTTLGCEGVAEGSIPDGTWTGPITVSVDGTSKNASGTITSTASGTMTITVAKGKVTGGTFTFEFQSNGTVEVKGGGTGTIKTLGGTFSGTPSGPASAPVLSGTSTIGGVIAVTVQGFATDVPIDETHPATSTLTVEQSTCDEVGGTFIPSFNASTGGEAYFTGTAHWSGKAA